MARVYTTVVLLSLGIGLVWSIHYVYEQTLITMAIAENIATKHTRVPR